MTNELSSFNGSPSSELAEQVAVVGDLAQLTAAQRMTYYSRVCDSLGINPFTQPFQYIRLNNKLVLYATRTAADQLRKRNGVSLDAPRVEFTDDLCIVTVTGHDTDGRSDTEIGAVTIAGLKGEARANAIMKAVTKAKRRLTLSICGLGWLDETEVETIRDARPVSVTSDGEIIDGSILQLPEPTNGAKAVQSEPSIVYASGPLPDDEMSMFEEVTAGEFVATAAEYLQADTTTLRARMKALGYTGVPGKPAERLKAYRALKADLGENVQTELFDTAPVNGGGAYQR
jgi:hypothetical protein